MLRRMIFYSETPKHIFDRFICWLVDGSCLSCNSTVSGATSEYIYRGTAFPLLSISSIVVGDNGFVGSTSAVNAGLIHLTAIPNFFLAAQWEPKPLFTLLSAAH